MAEKKKIRKPQNAGRTIARLLLYMRRHWLLLATALALMAAASLSSVAASYPLKTMIDDCIVPNIGAKDPDWSGLKAVILRVGILFAVNVAAAYGQTVLMTALAHRTIHSIRRDLFRHVQGLPVSFFDSRENGEIMSYYLNDADAVQMAVEQTVPALLSSILTLGSVVIIMVQLNVTLFLVIAVFVLLAGVISAKMGVRARQYSRSQQQTLAEVNGYIEELVEGIREVKAFTYEERAVGRFQERNERYRRAATMATFVSNTISPAMVQLMCLCYTVVTVVGAFFILDDVVLFGQTLTVGTLGLMLTYTKQLRNPINQTSNQVITLMSALAGAERIFEVMDLPPEEDAGTVSLVRQDARVCWEREKERGPLEGHIVLDGVGFGYIPGRPVLHDVHLEARPGEHIALVGSTGAGKTTIANLLNRFYDVDEGVITYDGIDIRDIRKDALRRSMAVVLQDTHLFSGTVLENIRVGDPAATDEECIEAAKMASAYSFIMALPDGFATRIENDGSNISQGQRQLLNIARAIVADRPVLILDEATSSVDTCTEELISEGLRRLCEGRTTFIIAHRLSTVRSADKIAVLEAGRIVEFGSHEELLTLGGRYSRLYHGQSVLD